MDDKILKSPPTIICRHPFSNNSFKSLFCPNNSWCGNNSLNVGDSRNSCKVGVKCLIFRNRRSRNMSRIGLVANYLKVSIKRSYFFLNFIIQSKPSGYRNEHHHHANSNSSNGNFNDWCRDMAFATAS